MNEHGVLSFGKVERKPSVSHALSSKVPQIFMRPCGCLGGRQVATRVRLECQVGRLDSGLKIFRVSSQVLAVTSVVELSRVESWQHYMPDRPTGWLGTYQNDFPAFITLIKVKKKAAFLGGLPWELQQMAARQPGRWG